MIYFWFIFFIFFRSTLQDCSWNKCHEVSDDPDVITAHLIPHTHDDLGWIKTVDQYYYGARPDLVPVGVQYIYNTVIDELLKNPDRKFSFAETGFLWRWYDSNSDYDRHQLQKLVKNGQIEIIGGGWVQNDEAASHYVDIIDQMTLGLQKLEQIFGECGKPQTGWQIDPFGHSREMANLYSQMGYSNLYFARIHYLEKELRLKNKTLEFNWNASDDLQESKIFTGAFFQDNYGPPEGFCWDALCGDDPIMDNPDLEEYNVNEKVNKFVEHVKNQAAHQKTNHVMLLMGSDFQYTNANSWYSNLDKLIKYVNADTSKKVKVIYSTPTCYSNAVKPIIAPKITEKSDDFFPYASANHSYWTGYFTSRPTFKGMIRKASQILQLSKQLDAQGNLGPEDDSDILIARKASALNQHHDAVTGTAKENVTRDYEKQLHRGISEVENVISDFMKKIEKTNSSNEYRICHLINETICEETRGTNFVAVVFNSNSKVYKGPVRIPVWSQKLGVNGNSNYEVVKTFNIDTLQNPNRAPFELHVNVEIPALGYTTLKISESSDRKYISKKRYHPENSQIENQYLRVNFNDLGLIQSVYDKETGTTHQLQQKFLYYQGQNSNDSQPSGAYIFRPLSQKPIEFENRVKVDIVQGDVVAEARQKVSPWVFQTIRLPAGKRFLEFEWTVGPIPKEEKNPITKEFITRYITDINNQEVFYTDSNGRQVLRRKNREATSFKYSDDEPVAGNYYPITSFGYIKDSNDQFSVITDRAQGLTSGSNGVIDILIHRRCFYDDHFGVEEALDEPGNNGKGLVAMGKHTVFFSTIQKAAESLRPLIVEKFNEPLISFPKHGAPSIPKFTGLTKQVPEWINLLTLEKWNGKKLLLRFEHIYHESDGLSKLAVTQLFDFQDLFTNFEILSAKPLKLGANRNMTASLTNNSEMLFTIRPSEILTFELDVEFKI